MSEIPEEIQAIHRTDGPTQNTAAKKTGKAPAKGEASSSSRDVWQGWADAENLENGGNQEQFGSDDEEGLDLGEMGL